MTSKPSNVLAPAIIRPSENVFDKLQIFVDKDLKWNPIKIETHLLNVLDQMKEIESPYFSPPLLNDTRF